MRIEMVLPSLVRAGMETVAAALAEGLTARGHEVGFTCIEHAGELGIDLREAGVRVSVVPVPGLRPIVFPRELARWFSELRPDVVHAHSGVWLKAVRGARAAGVSRTVYTAHGVAGLESRTDRLWARLALRYTDRLVAVSEPLREHIVRTLGLPPDRVRLILNGVSTTRYSPGPPPPGLRESLGIPADAMVVGCIARFHPVKNHALLVDAFARLREHRPEAFLLLVGDGPLRAEVERRIGSLGLGQHVHITGLVGDTAPILRTLDLFALASHTEGTSISLLEAMASGVPVVATAVGGNPSLLDDGRCGLLTPPGDAAGLAGAMLRLVTDTSLRGDLSRAARQRVIDSFSVQAMADAYEKAYTEPPDS